MIIESAVAINVMFATIVVVVILVAVLALLANLFGPNIGFVVSGVIAVVLLVMWFNFTNSLIKSTDYMAKAQWFGYGGGTLVTFENGVHGAFHKATCVVAKVEKLSVFSTSTVVEMEGLEPFEVAGNALIREGEDYAYLAADGVHDLYKSCPQMVPIPAS